MLDVWIHSIIRHGQPMGKTSVGWSGVTDSRFWIINHHAMPYADKFPPLFHSDGWLFLASFDVEIFGYSS
jgi:hypothetical protein